MNITYKKIFIYFIIVLFISSNLVILPNVKSENIVHRNILYVGGNGNYNYTSIQEAINSANNGDTVFVYTKSSPYKENVIINRSINLISEKEREVVIKGDLFNDTILVLSDHVYIKGFKIVSSRQSGFNDSGIDIRGNYTIIENNTIEKNYQGIYIDNCSFNVISNNTIFDNGGSGILVYTYQNRKSNNNTIFNNIIEENNGGLISIEGKFNDNQIIKNIFRKNGASMSIVHNSVRNIFRYNYFYDPIEFTFGVSHTTITDNYFIDASFAYRSSEYCLIENNEFYNSSLNLYSKHIIAKNNSFSNKGIIFEAKQDISYWNTHIFENNTIDKNPICFYANENNVDIPINAKQIILANCIYSTIKNFLLDIAEVSIQIGFSQYNNISNNTVDKIMLVNSDNNNISNNTIMNESTDYEFWVDGIILWKNSNANYIHDNILNKGGYIEIHDSSHNIIEKNFIDLGGQIRIYGDYTCYNNLISSNIISNSLDGGIFLSGTRNNVIYNNTISNSYRAIYIKQTYYNIIFKNKIKNNIDGFFLRDSAIYNTFILNNISDNDVGINLISTNNNLFYYNSFNNNLNVQEFSNNDDSWNAKYPIGGNYWNDYNGIDQNNDGIGDTPYIINDNITDKLPLVSFDRDLFVHIPHETYYFSIGEPVVITGFAVGGELPYEIIWDFGDRNNEYNTDVTYHTYKETGEYTVTFTITDNEGTTKSVTTRVIVSDYTQPKIEIISPKNNLYIFNHKTRIKTKIPVIIGNVNIEIKDINNDIKKVNFYVNENLEETIDEKPFVFTWYKEYNRLNFKHKITVICYDQFGNSCRKTLSVYKFF